MPWERWKYFNCYVAAKTWGSCVLIWCFNFGVVIFCCVGELWMSYAVCSKSKKPCCLVWAAMRNTCCLDWWLEGTAVVLATVELSFPDWPTIFQGQKNSKILICRCVTVPSADFWGGGVVLTCMSGANCLLIQFKSLQFEINQLHQNSLAKALRN